MTGTAPHAAALPLAGPAGAFCLLCGAVFGSFLNVLIHRLPRGESPWQGRSRCPHCRRTIRWYENVPVLSFVCLRGRCAGCHERISWRYPAVELATGLLALLCVAHYGFGGAAGAYFLFLAALLAIACIDWEHRIIPDELSLGVLALGIVFAATVLPLGVWRGLLGALVGGGFVWGVGRAYKSWRGVEGMGFGDVKLAAMIGAFLGPVAVLLTIFGAAFMGSVYGMWLVARGGHARTMVAFGTFLAAGAVLCLFFGDTLTLWYTGLWRR
jgi:leader peptidase (prepilin peptidase) / N-methyltransferase